MSPLNVLRFDLTVCGDAVQLLVLITWKVFFMFAKSLVAIQFLLLITTSASFSLNSYEASSRRSVLLPTKQKGELFLQDQSKMSKFGSLPCVPTLDTSGLLPLGTYYLEAPNSTSSSLQSCIPAKPTCRIQIAWDVSLPDPSSTRQPIDISQQDISSMISNMQHALDHGLTTFQLKPYSSSSSTDQLQYSVYKALIYDTPKSVLDQQCQFMVPLFIHDALTTTTTDVSKNSIGYTISSQSVRKHITSLLDRLGTDSLDCVQIQFPIPSGNDRYDDGRSDTDIKHMRSQIDRIDVRYYLELLYELQELVRDGYIRSISMKDCSNEMYKKIRQADLHSLLYTNQIDANICRISPLILPQHIGIVSSDITELQIPNIVAANPLAGGWLTDRFWGEKLQRPTSEWIQTLSYKEKWNWEKNVVQEWLSSVSEKSLSPTDYHSIWDTYQAQLMKPLHDIARKHSVSISSIVLRWMLQQQERQKQHHSTDVQICDVSSTVVSCRLLPEQYYWDIYQPHTTVNERVQQLREVVQFALDDDDMNILWNLSGHNNRHLQGQSSNDLNEFDTFSNKDAELLSNGLYIPKVKGFYKII
jgi:diketogulonate reductase-like aldo/keto reductase